MRTFLSVVLILGFLAAPSASHAQTQDWIAVQSLLRETRVIVRELGGHGRHVGHVRGHAWLMRVTFAAEAYVGDREPRSTIASAAIAGGIGALIDYGIDDERVVYRAPRGTVTLLRMSF